MTEFTFDPLSADDEFTQRRKHFEDRARQQRVRPGETSAPALPTYTDRELALQVLQSPEKGLSELEAYRALERDEAGVFSELATEIERERGSRANRDSRQIAAQRAASPEGRALAAATARDAERRQAERVEAGKALLRSDPEAHGVTAAMIDELTAGEVLRASAIEQSPNPDNTVAANAAKAAEGGTDQ